MKKEKSDNSKGLVFRYILQKDDKENLLFSVLISISIFLAFKSMFNLKGNAVPFVVVEAVVCILYFNKKTHKFANITGLGVIVVILAMILFKEKNVCDAIYILNNEITQIIGRKVGVYLAQYEISAVGNRLEILRYVSLFLLSFAISIWCSVWIYKRFQLFIYIPAIIILYCYLFTSISGTGIYGFVLALVLMAGLSTDNIRRRYNRKTNGIGIAVIYQYIAVFLVIGIIFGGVTSKFFSEAIYRKFPLINNIHNNADELISYLRYEKGNKSIYTYGDFSRLKDFTPSDEETFEIIMKNPESMYLRGFVGSIYTHTGWKEESSEELYDDYSYLFWLHKDGFYGLQQLSKVAGLTGKTDEDLNNNQMIIHNVAGNSKYLYLPYEWSAESNQDFKMDVWDISTKAEGLTGDRYYKISVSNGIVKDYPSIAFEYYRLLDEDSEDVYTKEEEIYNNFVYKHFLKISDDMKSLLYSHLGPVPNTDGDHISYEDAYNIITNYLNKNVVYDENPGALPDKTDFLQYFLETNGRGYAAQYATAAVMMYRYLGIPARYVEGYIITTKQAEDAEAMEPIIITEKNAHAWAEIYQDGIGWVPIEVTPPYQNIMKCPEYFGVSSENVAVENNTEKDSNDIHNSEEINKQYTKDKAVSLLLAIIKISAIAVFIAVLTIIFYIIFRRHITTRKRKSNFTSPDYGIAIKELYKYILILFKYDNTLDNIGSIYNMISKIEVAYGKEYAQSFTDIIPIIHEASYSTHIISYEKYKSMNNLVKNTLQFMIRKRNIFQRLYMKYWKALY